MNKLLVFLLLFAALHTNAQQITGKVVDALTNKPLGYATVLFNNQKSLLYTDSTGKFTLQKDTLDKKDSIYIQYLGYKRLAIAVERLMADNLFRMGQQQEDLAPVTVTNCRQYKDYMVNKKAGRINEYIGPGPETKFIILGRYIDKDDDGVNGYIKQLQIYAGTFNAAIHVPVRIHWYDWDSTNNMPGRELTNTSIIVYPYQKGWNSFGLPANSIYYEAGGIVIGLEFIYPVEYMHQYTSLTSVDEKAQWLMTMANRWSVGIQSSKDADQCGFYLVNNLAMQKYSARGRNLYVKPAIRLVVSKCMD
jgi:hypothetical protein